MPDYSKGKIYKILNNIDNEVYVGSTIETLGKRMGKHRHGMTIQPHLKLYEHMNELGVDNFYIELIENFPCNDIYELRAREGHFIREIGTLNKVVSGRTAKEYREAHKEEHREYDKEYREKHKEHIRDQQKEYYEKHKEHRKEYNKQYREEHKQEITEKSKVKMICECGRELRKSHLNRHLKTDIHKQLMEQQTK